MSGKNDDVVLLNYWPSVFGMRVRIALEEKSVEYEYREEDLYNKSDLLLQLNPVHKKIPVLVHNGKPFCESSIIVQYIDEVWRDSSPLLPKDPCERAQVRFWVDYIDKKVHEVGRRIIMLKPGEGKEAGEELVENLKFLEEKVLGQNPYFGGNEFGFVDIALIPYASWFYTYETIAGVKIEESSPKIVKWARLCMERQSVSKTLPHPNKLYQFVMGLRKKSGVE